MNTQQGIIRERELLRRLGMGPVKQWPPRCYWYKPDGELASQHKLPSDPYSRMLYLGRGLRPDVDYLYLACLKCGQLMSREKLRDGRCPEHAESPPTLDSIITEFMNDKATWSDPASVLLSTLQARYTGLPVDALRLSKALSLITPVLEDHNIHISRHTRGKERILRIRNTAYGTEAVASKI